MCVRCGTHCSPFRGIGPARIAPGAGRDDMRYRRSECRGRFERACCRMSERLIGPLAKWKSPWRSNSFADGIDRPNCARRWPACDRRPAEGDMSCTRLGHALRVMETPFCCDDPW
jgi:hypothetical protein